MGSLRVLALVEDVAVFSVRHDTYVSHIFVSVKVLSYTGLTLLRCDSSPVAIISLSRHLVVMFRIGIVAVVADVWLSVGRRCVCEFVVGVIVAALLTHY